MGEAAGLVGTVAALAVCVLAYGAYPLPLIQTVAGVAAVGTVLYIVQVIMRRVAGITEHTWREVLLATIVPFVALVVAVIMVSEVSGFFHLPFAGEDNDQDTPVIEVSPDDMEDKDSSH